MTSPDDTFHPQPGSPAFDAALDAASAAMTTVTPPPGWTVHEWVERFGRRALIAGAVAAALRATTPPATEEGDLSPTTPRTSRPPKDTR